MSNYVQPERHTQPVAIVLCSNFLHSATFESARERRRDAACDRHAIEETVELILVGVVCLLLTGYKNYSHKRA